MSGPDTLAMNTILTVVTIAAVVVILAVVLWTFLVAPFRVPPSARRS
jgi:hypothetical protein